MAYTCSFCKEELNITSDDIVKISARKYAHRSCYELSRNARTKEEVAFEDLNRYIQVLFCVDKVPVKVARQIETFHDELGYTYSGILKTLKYWFEINHNDIEKTNGGIGIVPYVYEQSKNYYYQLYLKQQINKDKETNAFYTVREIEIPPPTTKFKQPKLFSFDDEEE